MAHTFHLGMTDNRVPRWFSEGLAVHEEHRAREGWGGDVSIDFLEAFREDKLLPVSELNNGFVRPSYPQQIIHSYYQASLVFEFIERTWGFEVIKQMLQGFKKRQSTEEAIMSVLNMDMETFDQAFDIYFRNRFIRSANSLAPLQRMMEIPGTPDDVVMRASWEQDSFRLQMQAGQILLDKNDLDRAEAYLLRASELIPEYAGDDSPYLLLAGLYEQRGDITAAAAMMKKMVAINSEHYDAHIKLAELLQQLDDKTAAADVLERANYIHPLAISLHEQLAGLYGDIGVWQKAAAERHAVVALNPVDMAEARYQLANAYYHGSDLTAARRELLQALEIAPNFDQGLELLLQIRDQRKSTTLDETSG
jgi:tetratricopeptide (TPR) repeat protein